MQLFATPAFHSGKPCETKFFLHLDGKRFSFFEWQSNWRCSDHRYVTPYDVISYAFQNDKVAYKWYHITKAKYHTLRIFFFLNIVFEKQINQKAYVE